MRRRERLKEGVDRPVRRLWRYIWQTGGDLDNAIAYLAPTGPRRCKLPAGHSIVLDVVVAVPTRDRPKMLTALLLSLSKLNAPDNCRVRFLIVENNEANEQEALVASLQSAFSKGAVHYVLEPRLGVASARNRAVKEVIHLGADLLVFVDDDETVPTYWLVHLIDGYRKSSAVLLGAPIRAAPLNGPHSWTERLMHRNISRRYRRNEKRAARRASLEATPRTTIVTNNWIGEVSLFTDYNLSFDEDLNWSGGEDTKFHLDVKSLGLSTGWVRDAPLFETIPRDRLTFRYQYRRAKDQSTTSFRKKLDKKRTAIYTLPICITIKAIGFSGLLLLMPFTLGATYLSACRTSGWIAGRVAALRGKEADHYRTVTGE